MIKKRLRSSSREYEIGTFNTIFLVLRIKDFVILFR